VRKIQRSLYSTGPGPAYRVRSIRLWGPPAPDDTVDHGRLDPGRIRARSSAGREAGTGFGRRSAGVAGQARPALPQEATGSGWAGYGAWVAVALRERGQARAVLALPGSTQRKQRPEALTRAPHWRPPGIIGYEGTTPPGPSRPLQRRGRLPQSRLHWVADPSHLQAYRASGEAA
jgi:hypothetical protein